MATQVRPFWGPGQTKAVHVPRNNLDEIQPRPDALLEEKFLPDCLGDRGVTVSIHKLHEPHLVHVSLGTTHHLLSGVLHKQY